MPFFQLSLDKHFAIAISLMALCLGMVCLQLWRTGIGILFFIGMICLLPLMAAIYFRFVSPPEPNSTSGMALKPFAFPYASLRQIDGQPMAHPAVGAQWLVAQIENGECLAACRDALYLTRQTRLALGRNMDRVQRILIVKNSVLAPEGLLASHPDLRLVHATSEDLAPLFGLDSLSQSPSIFLVDRRGFVVFRYEATVSPASFIRELGRLVIF